MLPALFVTFYRPAGYPDTSLGGVSVSRDDAYLVGDMVKGPDRVPEDAAVHNDSPVLRVFESHPGTRYSSIVAVPNAAYLRGELGMFGGNFVYASDSRFTAINGGHPIRVHDRYERHDVNWPLFATKEFAFQQDRRVTAKVRHDYSPGSPGVLISVTGDTEDIPLGVWRDIVRFVLSPRASATP